MNKRTTKNQLIQEIRELRERLDDAEETLRAIKHGEVDALVVTGIDGEQVFTLHSAEQPYRILIEQMPEGAVTLSETGVILYCNLRFAEMLHKPHQKVVASSILTYIVPDQVERFAALLRKAIISNGRMEVTLQAGNGTLMSTFITVSPLPVEVEGCLCMVVTDLTEQDSMRRNQAEIEQLNERLKRSMTETHHRVKNNLQIIASMVDMQVMQDTATLPVEEVKRLGRHVQTLAVVHDLLTMEAKHGGQMQTVSSQEVLEKLLPLLEAVAGGRCLHVYLEDARLTSRQATSLALVTNEIINNAIKHGHGSVHIAFRVQERTATLEVSDDGPGFPQDFDPNNGSTTGIALVENLSRWDLGGDVRYENGIGGGARVTISMALSEALTP